MLNNVPVLRIVRLQISPKVLNCSCLEDVSNGHTRNAKADRFLLNMCMLNEGVIGKLF